ncbi:MBL fold metallo-hydrolase [Bacillus sp. REN16]|uniref:MBL fold metallo-hydrolase n=1 Tax=Bacillus sp. REN16 TaxID=2887296 RepID=UPI002B4C2104|nr:MBL fold metallo-hydrolase [Bacillus sp. REN16]
MEIYKKENVAFIEIEVPNLPNLFIFVTDGMLVDTGTQSYETKIIPFLKEVSFDVVALTHSHEDHTGTAAWIQDNLNIPIYISPLGISICSQPAPYPKYRQAIWGMRKEFNPLPISDTIQSRKKEWKVLHTPGHADDHIALLNEDTGTLFSGDLFVSSKTKVIMRSESIPQIMESIRTVLTHDFGSMFCCHAGYIQDGKKRMRRKLEYLENLSGEVKNLYEKGLSFDEIDQKIFRKKYPITFVSEGEWDSLHIITSIIGGQNALQISKQI